MSAGSLHVEGAAENNLADVDVALGGGLTAIVGVSGSGKSSLAFDVVYHEARRRLLDALSLASPWSRVPPARVRHIRGLGAGGGARAGLRHPQPELDRGDGEWRAPVPPAPLRALRRARLSRVRSRRRGADAGGAPASSSRAGRRRRRRGDRPARDACLRNARAAARAAREPRSAEMRSRSTGAPGAAARSRRGRRTTSACARPRSSRAPAPRRFAVRWPRLTRSARRSWSSGRTDASIRLRSRRCARRAGAACRRFALLTSASAMPTRTRIGSTG